MSLFGNTYTVFRFKFLFLLSSYKVLAIYLAVHIFYLYIYILSVHLTHIFHNTGFCQCNSNFTKLFTKIDESIFLLLQAIFTKIGTKPLQYFWSHLYIYTFQNAMYHEPIVEQVFLRQNDYI